MPINALKSANAEVDPQVYEGPNGGNGCADIAEYDTVGGDMSYTDDELYSLFLIAAFFEGEKSIEKVANALAAPDIGILKFGDIESKTVLELRALLNQASISESEQEHFLRRLRECGISPAEQVARLG